MTVKTYETPLGSIHYWVNSFQPGRACLVFLPGLTADHRLFDKQVEAFRERYNLLVWDAPGHGASWPFTLAFDLMDKARWLDGLLAAEGIEKPILIGQSMGGYVAQTYCQLFPEKAAGFAAIDSAPLQRKFVSSWELWLLKRMEPVYRWWPWRSLKKWGVKGVSVTPYGRQLMQQMMESYEGDQARYAKLSGHGMGMLAGAMEADLPYRIPCPAILICGQKDRAGSCIRYAKAWAKDSGLPLHWIADAGHNSNTDQPQQVNALLEELFSRITKQ